MKIIIYIIFNLIDNCTYVGSTSQAMKIRFSKHKSRGRNYKNKLYRHCDFIGWENIQIKQLAQLDVSTWEHAKIIEQSYIDILSPILNSNRAIATHY